MQEPEAKFIAVQRPNIVIPCGNVTEVAAAPALASIPVEVPSLAGYNSDVSAVNVPNTVSSMN